MNKMRWKWLNKMNLADKISIDRWVYVSLN